MPSGPLAASHHSLSSSERMPHSICSPKREARFRASFQTQLRFPVWMVGSFVSSSFAGSHSRWTLLGVWKARCWPPGVNCGFLSQGLSSSSFRPRHCSRPFHLNIIYLKPCIPSLPWPTWLTSPPCILPSSLPLTQHLSPWVTTNWYFFHLVSPTANPPLQGKPASTRYF